MFYRPDGLTDTQPIRLKPLKCKKNTPHKWNTKFKQLSSLNTDNN